MSILSLEELFAWPIVAYRLPANWLLWITAAVLLFPPAAALLRKGRERVSFPPLSAAMVFAALVVGLAMASSVFEYRPNNDDAFYVTNAALFAQASRINLFDSSMGDVTTLTMPMYDFQVWESLLSVLCRVFRWKATVVMHTLVIAPLIFLSACAYFTLGKALFGDDRKALCFTGMITVFHLGCKYVAYSEGLFLLNRIWQGKSVNLTVVLPLLAAEAITLFSEEESHPPVLIWLCVLAGAALNPTSLYINGFELLFVSISMALMTRRANRLPALLPAVLITAAFTLLIYLRTKNCVGIIESASTVSATFFSDTVKTFFDGVKGYAVLYCLSLLYILFRGDRRAKTFFLVSGVFMLVFLWNPLSGRFIAEKITKEPTYWRVFWLVPLGAGISWAITDIVFAFPERFRIAAAAGLLLLVVFEGSWPLEEYTVARNVEKISPALMKISESLQRDPVEGPVLACKGAATVLRQEDPRLWLMVSKRTYILDIYTYFGRKEEGDDRLVLYDFANGELEDCSPVPALLDKYGVERIIVTKGNKKAVSMLEAEGWQLWERSGSYCHYKRAPA